MKLTRLIATIAVLLGICVSSASAVELTKILPEPSEKSPISGTGTAGKLSFETASAEKLVCKEAKGTGEFTTPNNGQAEVHVTGCTFLGLNCNSVGAKAGEITLKDEIHYWAGFLGGKLIAVAVGLITKTLTIECPSVGVKMEKKGCTAGEVPASSLNKKVKSFASTVKQAKGKQEITEILPPKSEKTIKCVSEISKNGGKFEEIGQEGGGTIENFKQNGSSLEIELMF